ncbi:MAG: hypothetical protein JOY93_04355 [Acidobacteriales bacterium]|nr:hypothetical protein [Terriglobales bacterium]
MPDPRTKSTAADRALQHKVVMQLYNMLAQLTYVVDASNDLRDQARQRLGNAPDAQLKDQLNTLVGKLEEFRSSLVSVKEGGMITGEKKLRENLGELYGAVNQYSGRPTQSQVESTAVMQKKLDESGAQFRALTDTQLAPINAAQQSNHAEPLKAMSHEEWEKKQK